jgi:hypothetical protein
VKRKLHWSDTTPDRFHPQLDAKVQRYRKQQRERVEGWKDRLLNQVFEPTDPASHADLVLAMLEIAIEWRIAHLGADCAEDLLHLAFRRLAKAARVKLN